MHNLQEVHWGSRWHDDAIRGFGHPAAEDLTLPSRTPTKAKSKDAADWQDALLTRIHDLIKKADPEAVEEMKWKKPTNPAGVPLWSHDGMICTVETYKDKVKITFAYGAALKDPAGIFNASLDAGTRRAIDIFEDDKLDEKAFKALIRDAVAHNMAKARK